MKTIKKIIAIAVCVCMTFAICVFDYYAIQKSESQLFAWIKMAESLLEENKTYISGLSEFEIALATAKAGGNEAQLTENLKAAWGNLWYTVRTQVSVPDTYSLNKTDVDLGTHSSTKSAAQPKFEWKLPTGEEYWSNVVSFDFYAGGYNTANPNANPNANSANLSLKFTDSAEYVYVGSTYSITKKGFTPTLKQFVIPASYFSDAISKNNGDCELLIFKNATGELSSNTITVGSLFVTKKYKEELPCEPATLSVEDGNINYGTTAVFSVPTDSVAYYTTDGTMPTVYSPKCRNGQEIAIQTESIKILTKKDENIDAVVDYNFTLSFVSRDEILSEIESVFEKDIDKYTHMSDTQLAANALVIEQGSVSNAKYTEFKDLANSFAVSSVMNIKSKDLREILKRSSKYNSVNLANYYDTQILKLIKSVDVSSDLAEVRKEFELVRKYIDSAVTVIADNEITGGSIEINGIFATDNDKVTILLNPDDGYKAKIGSLMVYQDDVATIIPDRVGYRENTYTSDGFAFTMPDGNQNVVVSVIFEGEENLSPLGHIGRAKRENISQKDGLRLIYRCYLSDEIEAYGIILTSKTVFDNIETNIFDLNYVGTMTRVDSRDKDFKLYDSCDEYVDFSAMILYEEDSINKSNDIVSRSYAIMKNGDIYYSDLLVCSYNDLSNKILSGNNLIYSKSKGINGKILSASSNSKVFVAGNTLEFELETIDTNLNPYDDDQIAMDIELKGHKGNTLIVPAFYDGENIWKFRFVLPSGGFWKYNILLKEKGILKDYIGGFLEVGDSFNDKGDISVCANNPSKFSFTDGSIYTPMGINVAWQNSSENYVDYINKISAGGGNYMRMWLSDYGMSLFNNVSKPDDYSLTLKKAQELDKVIESAEENGVYLQIALFNHELFQVNKSWCNNPFNSGNNGYLNAPSEFWSDSRAIEDTKDYIRYIMARYGYSSSVLSFELCNEITSSSGSNTKIDAWSREMAEYIKSFTCYSPLVSSSCANPADSMLDADYLDFINLHIYNYTSIQDIRNKVSAMGKEKPVLISEIGVDYNSIEGIINTDILRQNVWSGVMSGSAGGAASWYWNTIDSMANNEGYKIFGKAFDFANNIPFSECLTTINGSSSYSNIKYIGYSSSNGKWLWVYDNNAVTTINNTEPIYNTYNDVSISVSIPNGTYKVEIYDTLNGTVKESKTTIVANGTIKVNINNFDKDTAVAIYKN